MVDVILQLVVEGLFSLVSHWFIEPYEREHGREGCARALVLSLTVSAVATLSLLWGVHVRNGGHPYPRSAVVAGVIAGIAAIAAVVRRLGEADRPPPGIPSASALPPAVDPPRPRQLDSYAMDPAPLIAAVTPWRWSARRLLGFALLNALSAVLLLAGYAIGTPPHIPG